MSIDDLLALAGLLSILAGVYLWLGLAAVLILFGIVLVLVAWRIPVKAKREDENA